VTLTSLSLFVFNWVRQLGTRTSFDPSGPLSVVLFVLAVMLLVEAVIIMDRTLRARRVAAA
jgi:hypothetical protein